MNQWREFSMHVFCTPPPINLYTICKFTEKKCFFTISPSVYILMNYKRTWNKQTVLLTFVAKNSVGLTAEIYGILSGIPVKFRMPNPNGCQSSNITCPIKSGDQYTYSGLFNVLPTYPNVSIWSVCLYITLLLDFMKKNTSTISFSDI